MKCNSHVVYYDAWLITHDIRIFFITNKSIYLLCLIDWELKAMQFYIAVVRIVAIISFSSMKVIGKPPLLSGLATIGRILVWTLCVTNSVAACKGAGHSSCPATLLCQGPSSVSTSRGPQGFNCQFAKPSCTPIR